MRPAGPRLLFFLLAPVLGAQTIVLDPVAVTATRAAQPATAVPFSLVILDGADLRTAPTVTLDGALRSVPGFSLFRRSDSLTANPTAQGVSLRGLGPSGASRSLVLLDGVPLNDPFGGWITWTKVSRESLAGVELVRGGGATAWGNAALGGVVQLLTTPPSPGGRLAATFGDFSTRSVELALTETAGPGTLELSGRDFSTDGFALVAPEDRGLVDIAAWSRHHWLAGRWTQVVGENATLTFTGRTFREQRGNGTAYQHNSSAEDFGSVTLTVRPAKVFSWTALAYGQDQMFRSTFSSVNATRTAETPASDQFAVPAVALGAAWTGSWAHPGDARTSASASPAARRDSPGCSCSTNAPSFPTGDSRLAPGSTTGASPTGTAAKPTGSPVRCCAMIIMRIAMVSSSARVPGWSGPRRRPGACVRPPSRPSAGRRSTNFTGRSAWAASSPRLTPA